VGERGSERERERERATWKSEGAGDREMITVATSVIHDLKPLQIGREV